MNIVINIIIIITKQSSNQRFSLSLSQSTAEPCICGQEKMHPWHKKTHEQHDSLWESLAVTSPSVLLVKVVE